MCESAACTNQTAEKTYVLYYPCILPALGAPDQFTYDEVKNSLESIKGVTQVHSLRLWSLTVDLLAANVHLQIGKKQEKFDRLER